AGRVLVQVFGTYGNSEVIPPSVTVPQGNAVEGNTIGGTVAGLGNKLDGVAVLGGSVLSQIGGAGFGNLIVGNGRFGVYIQNSNSNSVQGNRIGNDAKGNAVPNVNSGVAVFGTTGTTIGGTTMAEANVIAGNLEHGILLGQGANNNTVEGNFLGNV